MIFVVNNDLFTGVLRGEHIAGELGVKCLFADLGGARNQTVVFVKEADRGLVLDAKDRNCRIVLDVIDFFCYKQLGTKKQRECTFGDLVDVLIVPNSACVSWYAERFPKAQFAVIPHQWDYRIHGIAQQRRYAAGYIGRDFNLSVPLVWGGENVFQASEQPQAASSFNLHLCLQRRDERIAMLKPATKIATASAVGANALTYRDPSATELLGPDYPFYVDSDPIAAIMMAKESFGGSDWKRGRELMKEVKERTSLKAIAALYRRLDDPAFLIDASTAGAVACPLAHIQN